MSGDTLNNDSVQNGLIVEKISSETEHIASTIISENTVVTQENKTIEIGEKTSIDASDSTDNSIPVEGSSFEKSKEITLKRNLSDLNGSETQETADSNKSQEKKHKDESSESPSLLSQKESTSQNLNSPAPVRFGFGSTLSDPKYSWLNNFGKTTEAKKDDNSSKAEKPTSLFGSFQSSGSSLSEITPLKTNGFDALLEKASDAITPIEKKSPAMSLQDTSTGEENEITAFEAKGRLHVMGEGNKWVERGVGLLKVNYKKDDKSNRRLIMRLEAVHKVILNVKISSKLKPAADGKFVRFSAFEKVDSPSFFLFRTISTIAASQMVTEMLEASE